VIQYAKHNVIHKTGHTLQMSYIVLHFTYVLLSEPERLTEPRKQVLYGKFRELLYLCYFTLLTYLLILPPPSLEQSNGWCVDAVSLSRRQNYAVSYVLRCSRKLSEQLDRRDSMRSPYQTNQYCWIRTLSNTSTSITKKVKVAHTRLPSLEFRSWSRFLAVSLQVMWVINPVVGCHYFPLGLQ